MNEKPEQPDESRWESFLKNIQVMNTASLLLLWQGLNKEDAPGDAPQAYLSIGNRLLVLGEPLLAYDVFSEGLKHFQHDVKLRQRLALALLQSGAAKRAEAILTGLQQEGNTDEETLGILARACKERWRQAGELGEKRTHLRCAAEAYNQAYASSGGYWTGINAATLFLLLDEAERSRALAGQVRASCLNRLQERNATAAGERYWLLATLGEAALVLNELSEAEEWYGQAGEEGRGRFRDLAATRRNARLILDYHKQDYARLDQHLKIPLAVVFAGHMIDRPGRAVPRFPPQLEAGVKAKLREHLERIEVGFGYASAACGSDILFLETVAELGGETHIVLPFNEKQFIEESVEILPGAGWRERYHKAVERATKIHIASEQHMQGGLSYEYVNLLLQGTASIRAAQLETGLIPLAVWDGRAGDGRGGTATTIEQWRRAKLPVEIVDLPQMLRATHAGAGREIEVTTFNTPAAHVEDSQAELSPQIASLLFADALNFSKLTEDQIPLFLRHFLGSIGELISQTPYAPVMKNTWGDGLYFVFRSVQDAGRCALALRDLVNKVDWRAKGLPAELNLRIALHAGPVYSCIDPITKAQNYMGTHVSRAARLEPITPPGQVYASQAFAALAVAQQVKEFACDYVGQTPLAKGYGTLPTYHVRRCGT